MKILVSVIIVNYNGEKFLKNCFDSLNKHLSNLIFEIIVVDNLSTDNSINFIKENYPDIKLIQSNTNLGFGLGNNLGVKHAEGEYIFLFNNDTILLNPIDECINLLATDKAVGLVGINMLNSEKKYLPSVGKFPNLKNMIFFNKLYYKSRSFITGNFNKKIYEVDWIAGSFLILSKTNYIKIGGFDKNYFMYVEDVDFSKKISQLKLKRCFIPHLKYIHYVGFSTSKNHLLIDGYLTYSKKYQKGITQFMISRILKLKKIK